MRPIPCKDCISFAICNSKFNSLKNLHIEYSISYAKKLILECCCIRQYIYDRNIMTNRMKLLKNNVVNVDIGIILKFFINEDVNITYLMFVDPYKPPRKLNNETNPM